MCEDEAGRAGEPQACKDIFSHDGEQALGEILHLKAACLSPLPLAWNSGMMLVSEDSALLGSGPTSLARADGCSSQLETAADLDGT
ncbi:hypothetical protein FIBSPDRAFT_867579 [Athelia psychrophila]|uniref:Uncharacterized protein n=1 Tax=Athelia psychrophila TaxID=1759441 RepID=A0A166DVI9_9AGAM|nr:hypothetical protein FIBSPDRAFT_867579 [Fibularhizoctonia sp. CBS 109695]